MDCTSAYKEESCPPLSFNCTNALRFYQVRNLMMHTELNFTGATPIIFKHLMKTVKHLGSACSFSADTIICHWDFHSEGVFLLRFSQIRWARHP